MVSGESLEVLSSGSVQNNAQSTKKPGGVTGKGFKPGESGNPGGRPRMQPITELYKKILADPQNMADFEKSVVGIIKDGRMASMFQLKEMAERVEGKVTQSLEVKTELRDLTEAELLAKLETLRKEAE
jgi:hypothetical protein